MLHSVDIRHSGDLIRLWAVAPGIIRCVHTREAEVLDPSELIVPQPPLDAEVQTTETSIRCGNLEARFDPGTGCLAWYDGAGALLLQEMGHALRPIEVMRHTTLGEAPVVERVKTVDGERSFIKNLKSVVDRSAWQAEIRFGFADGEGVFGFGQGEEGLWNKRGSTTYLYQHNMRIPMPCFISSCGYGLLADCGCLMTFEDACLTLDCVAQLDYYVVVGDASRSRYDAIVDGFRRLTGRATLLPKWAFGYMQSKERYDTAKELADVVRRYRELGVPIDCVVQDWHTWREGRWGEKILDPARYGDLNRRMDEVHAMNAHAIVSVWPNMDPGTEDAEAFMSRGMMLNDLCTYNAFDSEARRLYWQQAERDLFSGGFDGWWCDSTEPFSGPDWGGEVKRAPKERYELVGGEHKKFIDPRQASLYSVAHAQGIYENQRAAAPDKRVFNLTRSGYASSQRYGAVLWSGDVSARWSVMREQIAEGLSMAACGYPWWTLDAGGFFVVKENWRARGCDCNTDPTPKWFWNGEFEQGIADRGFRELYTRWLQLAAFLPLFRSHGTDAPREIWNFGAPGDLFYDAIAETIRLRYLLMPYVYSLAGAVWRENTVMMRPLLFDFANDPCAVMTDDEYLFGPSLLVCPVTEPMLFAPGDVPIDRPQTRTCYLPAGCDWYDYHTNVRYAGGREVTVAAPIDRIPLFVRAGSILPTQEGLQYATDTAPLKIDIYPGADARFTLYDDAGDGYAYEQGEYTLTALRWDDKAQTLTGAPESARIHIIAAQ